jgi:hypothetical protein
MQTGFNSEIEREAFDYQLDFFANGEFVKLARLLLGPDHCNFM